MRLTEALAQRLLDAEEKVVACAVQTDSGNVYTENLHADIVDGLQAETRG